MIERIQKPDEFFSHLIDQGNIIYYRLSLSGTVYMYVAVELYGVLGSAHCESIVWSHNTAKQMMADWKTILNECRSMGAKTMIASYEREEVTQWKKFVRMLGFNDPVKVLVASMEV